MKKYICPDKGITWTCAHPIITPKYPNNGAIDIMSDSLPTAIAILVIMFIATVLSAMSHLGYKNVK